MKSPITPSEGIYYVVRFPNGWRLKCLRYADNSPLDHVEFWEQQAARELAAQWAATLSTHRSFLADELTNLPYAFPRGRISRVSIKFLIFHGNDLEQFMGIKKSDIESAFGIEGQCKWQHDDHEHCQRFDLEETVHLLGLYEKWKSKDAGD